MNIENLPITSNTIKYHKFWILYPFILMFSVAPSIFIASNFFQYFYPVFNNISLIVILPLLLLGYYLLFDLTLLLIVKLFLILLKLIHQPKEGLFNIDLQDKDYLFFCLRKSLKNLLFKLYNYFPLPWIRIFALKLCNIKTPNSVGLLDSYIDTDFIEFGEDSILGEGTMVMSSIIIGDQLLIKKVKLEVGCTVGAYSLIAPGTTVGKGSILGGRSYTSIGQHLESGWVYVGRPAKKLEQLQIE
ncbi:MAG: hypothetical protein R6U96_10700 [Promethearchaeia archaeon]